MFQIVVYDPLVRKNFRGGIYIVDEKPIFVVNTHVGRREWGCTYYDENEKKNKEAKRKTVVTCWVTWLPLPYREKLVKKWFKESIEKWKYKENRSLFTRFSIIDKEISLQFLDKEDVFLLGQRIKMLPGWEATTYLPYGEKIHCLGIDGLIYGIKYFEMLYKGNWERRLGYDCDC